MALKHLPIKVLTALGFNPPYWITAPIELLRFGKWYKAQPKPPAFATRNEYYGHVAQTHLQDTPIDFLEFGVFQGDSLRQWVTLNTHPESRFVGFDSFVGLPDTWRHLHKTYEKGHFDVGGTFPEIEDPRVSFVRGFFQDSLPAWLEANGASLGKRRVVLHCDADMYSSTLYVLTRLNDYLTPGSLILFDEFYSPEDEFRATLDWLRSYNRTITPIASVNPHFQRLAVEVTL